MISVGIYTTYHLLRTLEPSVPTVGIYKKTPIRLRRCLTLVVTVGNFLQPPSRMFTDIKPEEVIDYRQKCNPLIECFIQA